MFDRQITAEIIEALADTPVVLVIGPRQAGKTTLVRSLPESDPKREYVTLDDITSLSAARLDPAGFLQGRPMLCIDEVQRAPDLLLTIKAEVDRDRTPGRFILTGSANVLSLPKVSESLAGRMQVVRLFPLAEQEIEGSSSAFVDRLFDPRPFLPKATSPTDLASIVARAIRGGYPESVSRPKARRRREWFESYLTTVLQRDVRELANIDKLTAMPNLLAIVASRSTGLVNYADLANAAGLPQTTLKRYLTLLEHLFLVVELTAWHRNRGIRLTKSPKLILGDTGLMAHLLGRADASLADGDRTWVGPLLENFVIIEILKQISWSQTKPRPFHFRTSDGREVDLVLESSNGSVVGIEVKASATINSADFRHLRTLEQIAGNKFQRGVVLHTGETSVPFGPKLTALPISTLWS